MFGRHLISNVKYEFWSKTTATRKKNRNKQTFLRPCVIYEKKRTACECHYGTEWQSVLYFMADLLTPPMDDEEEEQLPRCCETPLRIKSSENGAVNRHTRFEDRSTQTLSSVLNSVRVGDMAPFQGSGRDTSSPCGAVDARTAFRAHCRSRGLASLSMASGAPGPRALFHGRDTYSNMHHIITWLYHMIMRLNYGQTQI